MELYSEVKELICETLEVPEDEISDDTHFVDDLGIDSILIIELKTLFEEKYTIAIDKDDLNELTSLAAVMNYLSTKDLKPATA